MPKKKKNQEEAQEEPKQEIDPTISLITKSLIKEFGNNVIVTPDNENEIKKLFIKDNALSTTNLTLDHMTGIGGIPLGRIIEIYGKNGAGKTTLSVVLSALAQKTLNYFCIYIDAEHRLDLGYAKKLGMIIDDPSRFLIIRPNNSTQVFKPILKYLTLGIPCAIILDSAPAIVASTKTEKDWGEKSALAREALEMSEFLKLGHPLIAKSLSLFIMVNQMRAKSAGAMWYRAPTSGNALPYYSTIRMNLSWDKTKDVILDSEAQEIGRYVQISFDKTNTSAPPKPRKICFKHGYGLWNTLQTVSCGVQEQIIKKEGSWLSYGEGENIIKVQGQMNFAQAIEKDKNLCKKIESDVKAIWDMKK